jgi:hypothetical protein
MKALEKVFTLYIEKAIPPEIPEEDKKAIKRLMQLSFYCGAATILTSFKIIEALPMALRIIMMEGLYKEVDDFKEAEKKEEEAKAKGNV